MKMNKRVGALAITLCVCGTTMMAGCKPKVTDKENQLLFYAVEAGYGLDWLRKTGEAFVKEDWVQKKYPGITYDLEVTTDPGKTVGMMTAGLKTNPYDIVFTTQPANPAYEKKDEKGNPYFLDLQSVLDATIPEEGQTVAKKMKTPILEDVHTQLLNREKKVYGLAWIDSYMGIFVNEDYVKEAFANSEYAATYIDNTWGLKLPTTTDGFVQMCEDLKAVNKYGVVSSIPTNYWSNMFAVWWAQYEGDDAYDNFWWGVNADGEQSSEGFEQQGRLESLKTMESIIGYDHGFVRDDNEYNSYQQAQRLFVENRGGAFMANGDWLWRETGKSFKDKISIFKTPVISSIINRSEIVNITTDEELAFVVQCVDKCDTDATYTYEKAKAEYTAKFSKTLTEAEYNRIFEARNVTYRLGTLQAHIPAYSNMTAQAKDFLTFLASDKAIEIVMQESGGLSPYKYDAEIKNPTLYSSFSSILKSRCTIDINAKALNEYQLTPLNAYGGVLLLENNVDIERRFMSASAGNRVSPQRVYESIRDHYMNNDSSKFNSAMKAAGLR